MKKTKSDSDGAAEPVEADNEAYDSEDIDDSSAIARPDSDFVTIRAELVDDASLYGCNRDVILYRRDAFIKETTFLENVISDHRLGWVLGSAGTGKSVTALAFALSLDLAKYSFTWIHLSRMMCTEVLHVNQGGKWKEDAFPAKEVWTVLEKTKVEKSKIYVIFIDGYVESVHDHQTAFKAVEIWYSRNKADHRLCVLSSMSSRGKNSFNDDAKHSTIEHYVDSWTREEYREAASNTGFFQSVQKNLASAVSAQAVGGTSIRDRFDMVDSKFYFAGGSSRYMFDCNVETVCSQIHQSISAVQDVFEHIFKSPSIVSSYAAREIAIKHGPSLVSKIAGALSRELNPALNDMLFEMNVFANLESGGLNVNVGSRSEFWPAAVGGVQSFDPEKEIGKDSLLGKFSSTWRRPLKWNRGGYDVVYVNNAGQVLFVQVTPSHQHAFKISYFKALLSKLSDLTINSVEIYFLVPTDLQSTFKISKTTGKGGLKQYVNGEGRTWKSGDEKNMIRIGAIKDVLVK